MACQDCALISLGTSDVDVPFWMFAHSCPKRIEISFLVLKRVVVAFSIIRANYSFGLLDNCMVVLVFYFCVLAYFNVLVVPITTGSVSLFVIISGVVSGHHDVLGVDLVVETLFPSESHSLIS